MGMIANFILELLTILTPEPETQQFIFWILLFIIACACLCAFFCYRYENRLYNKKEGTRQ